MNSRQKEVQQAHLDEEKKVIRQLQQVYKKASEDCSAKIAELASRTDMQNLQSIVYQKQYQQALKKQIDGVLDTLQSSSFDSIAEYLTASYQNGYTGAMYDLQGQGIPIITPLDQSQVVKAVQTDAKLSNNLYSKLGEDVSYLKKSIKAELSRGIATGSSWLEMAQKIAKGMNSPYKTALNNAIRIARTEGHRIQQQSQLDALGEAKDKGADIVKQWDATLDGRTRAEHREADGQIRELDDYFVVGGQKLSAPGVGGSAWNVCNCRCCMLQRARWALDENELKELQSRAAYYGLDKTADFNDYKSKYLSASQSVAAAQTSTMKSIDDCTDFSSLQQYFKDTYGVTVDDAVGKLDYASVQASAKGIEKVIQEFPKAQATLVRIATDNKGVMCASYSGTINYNPAYYSDASKLTGMIRGSTTGFHPKNTGLVETGSHEMGHLLERTLIEKSVTSGKYQFGAFAWNNSTEAKAVVSEACKAAKKTSEGRNTSTGKLYTNAQLKSQVSGYATKNDSECLAECVGDYVANGNNASVLSKEVWKILKRELG